MGPHMLGLPRLLAGVLVLLFVQKAAAVNCKLRSGSSCICDLDDGAGHLDLTPISKNNGQPFFKDVKAGSWTYSYNPCNTFTEDACKNDVATCQAVGKSYAVCGRQTGVLFAITGTTPFKGVIKYGGGDKYPSTPRLSYINFTCDESKEHDFASTGEHPRGTYFFSLASKYLCPKKATPKTTQPTPPAGSTTRPHRTPNEHHVSLGTILDICVLLVALSYVLAGTAFMYLKRGARGREALPNFEFWIAFPGLIKEGVLFIVNKIRRSPDSSYEQI